MLGRVRGRVRVCRDWEGVRCAGEGEGVQGLGGCEVCWGGYDGDWEDARCAGEGVMGTGRV